MSDSTREALAEISQRARGIVEELARHTRGVRSEGPAFDADRPPSGQSWRREAAAHPAAERATEPAAPPELHRRLNELRACVGEVADVLEATIERLETVEIQLGDPDTGIERQLGEGIVRCERVLMGIEHRIEHHIEHRTVTSTVMSTRREAPPEAESREELPAVLVLSRSSRRRADLCLALERQGLRALAASDLALAVRVAARTMPAVALVDLGDHDGAAWLEDWKEHEEQGTLPRAALLDVADGAATRATDGAAARAQGFETIKEAHGEAAMAASLTRIARDRANTKSGEQK